MPASPKPNKGSAAAPNNMLISPLETMIVRNFLRLEALLMGFPQQGQGSQKTLFFFWLMGLLSDTTRFRHVFLLWESTIVLSSCFFSSCCSGVCMLGLCDGFCSSILATSCLRFRVGRYGVGSGSRNSVTSTRCLCLYI